MRLRPVEDVQPEALSVEAAARAAGCGKNSIYNAINAGELKSARIGRRRVIRIDALRDWLRRLEQAAA